MAFKLKHNLVDPVCKNNYSMFRFILTELNIPIPRNYARNVTIFVTFRRYTDKNSLCISSLLVLVIKASISLYTLFPDASLT